MRVRRGEKIQASRTKAKHTQLNYNRLTVRLKLFQRGRKPKEWRTHNALKAYTSELVRLRLPPTVHRRRLASAIKLQLRPFACVCVRVCV